MVARTICEDSVLNHGSKLPWMKRQSTNCQEQVAIDIVMNVPPWTNRHNQITTADMSSRYCCDPCIDGIVESTGGVVLLIRLLPWLVQSACKMFARSNRDCRDQTETDGVRSSCLVNPQLVMSTWCPASGWQTILCRQDQVLSFLLWNEKAFCQRSRDGLWQDHAKTSARKWTKLQEN